MLLFIHPCFEACSTLALYPRFACVRRCHFFLEKRARTWIPVKRDGQHLPARNLQHQNGKSAYTPSSPARDQERRCFVLFALSNLNPPSEERGQLIESHYHGKSDIAKKNGFYRRGETLDRVRQSFRRRTGLSGELGRVMLD